MINQLVEHFFSGGISTDLDNNIKDNKTYAYGRNGRIFSKDGTVSFTGIEGTKEIYSNNKVARYLGACSFKDKLVLFAKCSGVDVNIGGVIYETIEIDVAIANNFSIDLVANAGSINNLISSNSFVTTYSENVTSPAPVTEIDIEDNYSPDSQSNAIIDFETYYKTNVNVPNFESCPINEYSIPVNNIDFADCIIVLQEDEAGNIYDTTIWAGYQNWPMDAKIVTLGVDENNDYQRVKYTDNVTPFKSINIKDAELFKRSDKELENFQSTVLLEPRIKAITSGGQLRSMAVHYFYRLITENGQVTEFSPTSKMAYIYPGDDNIIEGGYQSEPTQKAVTVVCNIKESANFNEVECVAIEYEASNVPTGVKSLGIKAAAEVVEFQHLGNESEFSDNLTLADITEIKTSWKYCSDLETKNNKLFASALRNDPVGSQYNDIRNNFALHGWSAAGATHSSLLNPDPVLYNLIPPEFTGRLFYIKKKIYKSVKVFGSSVVTFRNINNSSFITLDLPSSFQRYDDRTEEIKTWLLDAHTNLVTFDQKFPNLKVTEVDNILLFSETNTLFKTDLSVYVLQFDTEQNIQDVVSETVFDTSSKASSKKVHGAMSAGFNAGNGIRISYRMVEEELLTKATSAFTGNGDILNMAKPSFKKQFFKGEIYRLSLQLYKKGQRIFAVPLGDLKIPEIGDFYSYIDDNGNVILSSDKYVNQKVVGSKLYGVRCEMKVEFRMDCNFSKEFDMYQILYVERTPENRTILCQGVSAPLTKLQDPPDFLNETVDERLRNKWMLPYFGGPLYEKTGFDVFDLEGENYNDSSYNPDKRMMHHRAMMYFDSPDHVYGQIPENLIKNTNLALLGKLSTDHTAKAVVSSGQAGMPVGFGTEVYPKFSRKILHPQLNTISETFDWPKQAGDENKSDNTWLSQFVNVSVFSGFTHYKKTHTLEGAVDLSRGQVVTGTDLNSSFEISNNAFCLPMMPWWYSRNVRMMNKEDDQYQYEALSYASVSFGEKTLFLKSATNLFTSEFVGTSRFPSLDPQIRAGSNSYVTYDGHALINLKRGNESAVYGGRSEQAFSKNTYVPLSETKPIEKGSNAAQVFQMEGDSYVTLWARTKNSHGDSYQGPLSRDINNGRGSNPDEGDILESYQMNGAWCYAVVVETMVEPKLNSEYEFYRENSSIDFSYTKDEVINSAYLQGNTTKKYISRPFRFKDNPVFDNIVAASEVKVSGEYYDSWSSFLPNEFQELDKNKGAVLNMAKEKNEIFAIQEKQTNLLHIDRDTMIPTSDGQPINIKQGGGKSIDGFTVVSKYGTSIRRAICKTNEFGFLFVDENLKSLVKNDKPLTIQKSHHHDFYDKYDKDPIIDCEGFFDEKYKESNIRIRTESGLSETISYNEVLQLINGYYDYDSDIFASFNDRIFAPIEETIVIAGTPRPLSEKLHELNSENYLYLFGQEKKMEIGFYAHAQPNMVLIFKHIAMILGKDVEKIEKIDIETKQGLTRVIASTHKKYKNREGVHSVPLLNYWTSGMADKEKKDLRSEWAYFQITIPYDANKKQEILSASLYIRQSYQ